MKTIKHIYPMREVEAMIPQFASRFSCVGPDCALSCCMCFSIAFEKKNYDLLENQLGLTVAQKKNYKKCSKSQRSDASYAQFIAQGEWNACGFFEEGLCILHRDFGEQALCNVCYLHPRLYRAFAPDYIELSVSLSCPEAAKLALLSPDAFDFLPQTSQIRQEVIETLPRHLQPLQPILLDVRFFCIQILRVQDLSLWKRLALLSLFSAHLDEALASSAPSTWSKAVQDLIDGTTYLIQSGEVNTLYDEVQARDDYLPACYVFLKTIEQDWKSQPHFFALIEQLEQHLFDGTKTYDVALLQQNHQQGLKHLQASLKDHPYFLEHFLLSELFELSFPFCFKAQLPIAFLYRYLCFVYVFMRFVLAVYCVHEPKIAEELSFVIAKFMRFLQHVDLHTLKDLMNLDQLHWEDWGLLYAHLKDDL